jgi:hypothetical protein
MATAGRWPGLDCYPDRVVSVWSGRHWGRCNAEIVRTALDLVKRSWRQWIASYTKWG